MKKLLLTLFAVLTALQGWGVAPGSYTAPSQLPEAFEWTMVRYDYRGTDENGDPILVGQHDVTVEFDPQYVNSASKYGKLTLKNMYSHESLNLNATGQEFPFDNSRTYWAFQYDAANNTITFSFQATLIGRMKTKAPYSNSRAAKSSSTYAYIAAGKQGKSSYWNNTNETPYAYGGTTHVEFIIDLNTHTIESQGVWGVFYTKEMGANPSFVLEYFDHSIFREKEPTTLAWIEANGEKEQSYTIADRLMGVYAQGTSLWCKDLGNISNVKTEPATGAIDYMSGLMSELHQRSTADEWDQSNWVELVCDNAGMAASGEGKYIKAGTVTGKYTDDVNYTIRVTGTSLELDGEATYEPNYYSPVNFMCYSSAEQDNTSVRGTYGGRTYYFVNPKVQEYAIPTIAVWRGNNEFAMAARDVESDRPMNTAGLPGAYKVQWDLNNKGDVSAGMLEHEAYEFHAIVRRATNDGTEPASVPARTQSTLNPMSTTASADYEVWPLDLDPDNFNIVTEITAVGSDEPDGNGYYYTLTGQRVTNPAQGFYIHNGRKVIVR